MAEANYEWHCMVLLFKQWPFMDKSPAEHLSFQKHDIYPGEGFLFYSFNTLLDS